MSEEGGEDASHKSIAGEYPNGNPKPFEDVYELLGKIGRGGFGSVHIGRDRKKGDEFAIKVIDRSNPKIKDNAVFREVQTLRALSHPNIISLADFFVSPRFFNIVLELAKGGDLFDSIARRKMYTERDARSAAKEMLTAISYIHSKGFVHRDMKPENLLLADDGAVETLTSVKLGDFGFAKNISEAPTPAGLTSRCGTLNYMAPEQIKGKPYGQAVDIWGCGVILYLLLGGYHPFQGTGQSLFRQIIAADYEFIEKIWYPISVEAKQVITRMLAIDPKLRITADEALNSAWMAISHNNESISSIHLGSTVKGLRSFNAKRKLKGAMHVANYAIQLSSWNPGAVSFMPEDTIAGSTNTTSKTLERGKIGLKFDDMYSLVSELRSKNDTTVWKGTEKKGGKPRAIKIILRKNCTTDDESVLREVAILQSLNHKLIVEVLDYFEEAKRFLMVMDFIGGGNVLDRILKHEKYTEEHARESSRTLLTAVEYIHSCRIAHRNLKPQNLLLEALDCDCCLRIVNFGFARRVHSPQSLITGCGTPTYIAPEILNNHPHDSSVDMWSVGVIIFLLLVGYPPFMEDRQRDLFRKIRQGEYGFYGEDWDSISQQAKDMISSLLVVDPAHRSSAEKALQHEWFCGMDRRSLERTSLSSSQGKLTSSLLKTVSPDSEDAPWVTFETSLV